MLDSPSSIIYLPRPAGNSSYIYNKLNSNPRPNNNSIKKRLYNLTMVPKATANISSTTRRRLQEAHARLSRLLKRSAASRLAPMPVQSIMDLPPHKSSHPATTIITPPARALEECNNQSLQRLLPSPMLRKHHVPHRLRQTRLFTPTEQALNGGLLLNNYYRNPLGPKAEGHIRFLMNNPNKISAQNDFVDFQYICQRMLAHDVDVWGLSETGVYWKQGYPRNRCNQILKDFYPHSRLIGSTSDIPSKDVVQYGGTWDIRILP
jgi:hypothetical protein